MTTVKTLGDESHSFSTVKKLVAEYRRKKESVENYELFDRHKDATTDKNGGLLSIMCDRRSLRIIARQIGTRFGAVQFFLTDIGGMSKVSATLAPRVLTKDQKKSGLDFSKYLLFLFEDDTGIIASSCKPK